MKRQINFMNRIFVTVFSAITLISVSDVSGQSGSPFIPPCARSWSGNSETVKPENQKKCKTATAALASAAVIVFGQTITDDQLIYTANALASREKYKNKFADGLKFTDAVEWFKEINAEYPELASQTVKNAYVEVYGRDSKSAENPAWAARIKEGKAWYATIVSEGIKQLNQNAAARTEMLNTVYKTSMGRNARPNEIKHWLPRAEHARLIMQANREYLYSPNGAADLSEAVIACYKETYPNKPFSGTEFNDFIAQKTNEAKQSRSLYKNFCWQLSVTTPGVPYLPTPLKFPKLF